MDSDRGGVGFSQHRHKVGSFTTIRSAVTSLTHVLLQRTHGDMENEGSISPTWSAFRRLSHTTDSRNPSTSRLQPSNPHIPSSRNSSARPQRFPGDGMDYRRPISSNRNATPVIDLTADDAGPSTGSGGPSTAQRPPTTRAQRPPRFAREIIDVDSQTYSASTAGPDPEVQFISSRPIHPPRPPAFNFEIGNNDGLYSDDVQIVGINRFTENPRLRDLFQGHGPHVHHFVVGALATLHRNRSSREPVPPPRGGGIRRNRPAGGHVRAGALPMTLDFETTGFDMGYADPPPPTYDAPVAAPEGFTRSPVEDDCVVCPNCDDELCVGESELKRQVWVIKGCGHVSLAEPLSRNRY